MLRFSKNRCLILILSSCLCFACIASRPGPARAELSGQVLDGLPGATDEGDPDLPTGPTKTRAGRGAMQPSSRMDSMRTVGDGRVTVRVMIGRLFVIVRSLGSIYFRF